MALTERYWTKVNKNGPLVPPMKTNCWLWTAATNPDGYGIFHTGKRANGSKISSLAHKLSWEEANGAVPDGHELDHMCRLCNCVRPTHLVARTKSAHGKRGAATRYGSEAVARWEQGLCANGHPQTDPYMWNGKAKCRACRREASRRYSRRRRSCS